jgi:hypothetical protein
VLTASFPVPLQITVLEAARSELAAQLGRSQEALRARDAEVAALRDENERLKEAAAAVVAAAAAAGAAVGKVSNCWAWWGG